MADIYTFRPRPKRTAERLAPRQQTALHSELKAIAHAALDVADRLIAVLDTIEGDPDLEPAGDDEPSLGAPENHCSNVSWLRGSTRDLELDQQPEIRS